MVPFLSLSGQPSVTAVAPHTLKFVEFIVPEVVCWVSRGLDWSNYSTRTTDNCCRPSTDVSTPSTSRNLFSRLLLSCVKDLESRALFSVLAPGPLIGWACTINMYQGTKRYEHCCTSIIVGSFCLSHLPNLLISYRIFEVDPCALTRAGWGAAGSNEKFLQTAHPRFCFLLNCYHYSGSIQSWARTGKR